MKPMLAATLEDVKQLRFPMLASPKYDGIRAIVHDGVLLSRNWKPIPNRHAQCLFGRPDLNGLDGELIVGPPTDPACYRNTMSGVMSHDGAPNVIFYVFDYTGINDEFIVRHGLAYNRVPDKGPFYFVRQTSISNALELERYEEECLALGDEGVMLRTPDGLYKNGRSTMREQWLVKVKRFSDAEAEIVGFEEKMHNGNEATIDELGRTKRSSHKANKTGMHTLGAFVCRAKNGVIFNIGTGMDDATRLSLWHRRTELLGERVKYKFFPSGSKDAPRFPVFLGLRDKRDL